MLLSRVAVAVAEAVVAVAVLGATGQLSVLPEAVLVLNLLLILNPVQLLQ